MRKASRAHLSFHPLKWLLPACLLLALCSCEKEQPAGETHVPFVYTDSITDLEGNVYHTITIGSQVWMAENLRSKCYNNGDTIEYIAGYNHWGYTDSGATCIYDNNSEAGSIYGNLYNFRAVNDPRGIAPPGWHVPSYYKLIALMAYCGNTDAGNRLREFGNKHWIVANEEATDQYGFAALPGGFRDFQGDFYEVRNTANFWSSTHWLPSSAQNPQAWYLRITRDKDPTLGQPEHELTYLPYVYGCYVRCVKD